MIRAVVDTNVWVSALLNPTGAPARLLEVFVRGAFVAVLPEMVLHEIRDVLGRDRIRRRFALESVDVDGFVAMLGERAEIVVISGQAMGCRDPKDDAVLEAAVAGNADLLVTRDDDIKRDQALLDQMKARGVTVVSVAAFLRLLET